jgi:hypothetical protein
VKRIHDGASEPVLRRCLLRKTTFALDSQFNKGTGKRVPVHPEDVCCLGLILVVVLQYSQDEPLLKFSDSFMVEDVSVHRPGSASTNP